MPRFFFPGTFDAAASPEITLPQTGRVEIGTFTLPDMIRPALIAGTVRNSQGVPVRGAEVIIGETDSADTPRGVEHTLATDDDGRFERTVVAGQRYRIAVWWKVSGPMFEDVVIPAFDATPGMPRFEIVVAPPR